VTVNLYDGTSTLIDTTTTDANGLYLFENLTPGDYYVDFIPPAGYLISPQDQGADDAVDSDANTATGQTETTTLSPGENDLNWDAGLYQLASLGDYVWNDLDGDGIQDGGETGIESVTVNLYDGTNTLIDTTTTDANGLYLFENLTPGDYYVEFVPPAGFAISPQDQGANDAVDSDANSATGQTATTTLTAGENDLSWDAGLYQMGIIGIAKRVIGSPVFVSVGTWDVTFEILVKNYANVALSALQVTDNMSATFPLPTTFTVRSVSSAAFSENWSSPAQPADYNGNGNNNLLTGDDTLAIGGQGTITVVVRIVPASAGPFMNTAVASGQPPSGPPRVSDVSSDGTDPDNTINCSTSDVCVNEDGNPTNNTKPTPVTFGSHLFDPPFGVKVVNASGLPELAWTMVWINATNIVSVNAAVNDEIPVGTTYVPGSLSCTGASSQTTTTNCTFEVPGITPRGRVIWSGVIGPDFGATDAASADNELNISFRVTVNPGIRSVQNEASIDSDLNGDGDTIDAGEIHVATASASWPSNPEDPTILPGTGFAPERVTALPPQTVLYSDLGNLWLEIPRLGVQMPIVGIPVTDGEWDVSWLGNQAGWLNGTAFPTWAGNSVITGHVFDAFGKAGPFVHLNWLWYGDKVIVHAWGAQYVYEVRQVKQVAPGEVSSVLKHEELPWVTLVTCRGYDETSDSYKYRVVVRAVLVEVK